MAKGFAWWKVLLLASAAGTGVFLGQLPWRRYWEQEQRLAALRSDMRRAEAERERLAREKARLESPLFREALLRDQGMLKAGEKPLEWSSSEPAEYR
ncbi:MAG: med21 domain-containing protein [Fimbriimonadales bacterium]|nr:med21 domain-containing protein [Fimbriimonadales bacterium]